MRQTLHFRRFDRPHDVERLDEATDRYVTDYADDFWRVNWKKFGFPFCGLYLISQRSGWPLKVGISDCVLKRLNGLQTSNWNELVCSGYWILADRAQAQRLERRVHEVIADKGGHLLGEWFDLRADKAREIVEFEAQMLGIELATEVPKNEKFKGVHDYIWSLRYASELARHEMSMAEIHTGDGRTKLYAPRRRRKSQVDGSSYRGVAVPTDASREKLDTGS